MIEYHIGEEIFKEMRRQGMKPADFARALNRERQTVYDIFKKRHIATDMLTDICRVLNRDFFSELSRVNFSKMEEPEDSPELKEQISGLMPENELHTFTTGYLFNEVMEEFLSSERKKFMVVFYTHPIVTFPGNDLPTRVQQLAGRLWGDWILAHDKCTPAFAEPNYPLVCKRDNFISLVMTDQNYPNAIKMAETLNHNKARHVILYVPVKNKLRAGASGGLIYEDIADELFEAWQGRAHFVYVNDIHPGMIRNLYHAYRRTGIVDRLIDRLSKDDDIGMLLYDLVFGRGIMDVEEINPEDSTGLSRIKIFYRGSNHLSEPLKRLMFDNGVNNHPHLDMWLDIRNGYLVDFQYNKRTQP